MTPTSHDIRMHRFGPAHTAGAFGSPLSWLQVGVLLAGMYAAYLVFASTGVAGMLLAVGVVLATCVVVFVPMRGREPIEWLPLILHALAARLLGQRRRRSTAPGAGFAASENQPDAAGRSPMPDLPPDLKGVEILDAAFDRHRVGIIKDTRARTYAAVLKVRVGAFGLLSTSDQARRIEAWSSLLTSLCREGTPISRVQWIERTIPTDPDELVRYHLTRRDFVRDKTDDVVASYKSLINNSTAATQDHELFLVVQISQRRALDRLGAIDPEHEGVSAVNAWPVASRARWDSYQTDGAIHATYWVAEWPRRDVPATFLLPLLLQANMQRSISVVMEPLEISKALSRIEAAIVGDQTSEHVRSSKGFAQTARRTKRSTDLLQREAELAAGHGEFRYAGYVTVSAATRDELEHACAALENRALQSRLQLRRLNGLHELAFACTLPLARGLAGPGAAA